MDSGDVVDEVNALLKMGAGDSYRLEHIKQAYIQNKSIWVTDENYLKRMREKYLTKSAPEAGEPDGGIVFEDTKEEKESIFCWKCGKEVPLSANFCMFCGASLFEVGSDQDRESRRAAKPKPRFSARKIGIFVGVPVLALLIIGIGAASVGSAPERPLGGAPPAAPVPAEDHDPDSPCGPGTILDVESNSCILR